MNNLGRRSLNSIYLVWYKLHLLTSY
jgi:hypothetical protein